jgi:anti-sigma regulatory factor (Ser/Thr protein kinase)
MRRMMSANTEAVLRRDEAILPTENGIAAGRERAVEALGQAGLHGAPLFAIELCIQEALVNALIHGIRAGGGSKIRLAYALGNGSVWAEVEDNGCGFGDVPLIESTNVQKTRARGLSLIQAFTSRMQCEGNIISMELDFDADPPSSLQQIATMVDVEKGLPC